MLRRVLPLRQLTRCISTTACRKEKIHQDYVDDGVNWDINQVEDYKHNGHTTMGLLLLENVREVRKYLRMEKKDYIAPSSNEILSVKTCEYLGDPEHPASTKCSVTFSIKELPLADDERHMFELLCGSRWNPHTGTVTLAGDRFPDLNMNIQWTKDVLQKLISTSKNNTDKFTDITWQQLTGPKSSRSQRRKARRQSMRGLAFPPEWQRPPNSSKD